jgi:hypothetical protein
MKNLIFRSAYRTLRENHLNTFAGDVANRMKSDPQFAAFQPAVERLDDLRQQYDSLLSKARVGSLDDRVAKKLAKAALIEQLDRIAHSLEGTADISLQFLTNSGFPLRGEARASYDGPVEAITRLSAVATGQPGVVRCTFNHPLPKTVKVYAVEYSSDKGVLWYNKVYNDKRNLVLKDLPHSPEVWIRVRAIGRNGQLSDWSAPAMVAVP